MPPKMRAQPDKPSASTGHILVISNMVWQSWWTNRQKRAVQLAQNRNVYFVEPMRYIGCGSREHFAEREEYPTTGRLRVLSRGVALPRNPFMPLLENFHNLYLLATTRSRTVLCFDVFSGLLVFIFSRLMGAQAFYYCTDHPGESKQPHQLVQRWLVNRVALPLINVFAHGCIVTAHGLQDLFPKKATIVLPSDVELDRFEGVPLGDNGHAVFVGSLLPGIDYELVAGVARRLPDLVFDFYGDGVCVNEARDAFAGLDNVILHGYVEKDEVPKVIAQASIGIIPFRSSPLYRTVSPLKLFEYWAAKKPVVCSPTEELRKLAEDACLFADGEDEWVLRLKELAGEPELRKELGKKGYRAVLDIHNTEASLGRLGKFIQG